MLQQALKLRETVLGKEHPDTLMSMNDLAAVLKDQSKYEQAEEIHRQVLKLRETVLGKEHPDTLMGMNHLAAVLRDQGNYEQAEEMHRQVLEQRETVLGKEHPDTLTSMNDLARVLRDQCKYEQAEKMNQETLGLQETVLGKDHPDTLESIANLASVYSKQRRWGRGGESRITSDGKAKIGAWRSTSRHADGHGQFSSYMEVTRSQSRGDSFDEAGRKTMNSSEAVQNWQATDVDDSATH